MISSHYISCCMLHITSTISRTRSLLLQVLASSFVEENLVIEEAQRWGKIKQSPGVSPLHLSTNLRSIYQQNHVKLQVGVNAYQI